MVCDSQLMDEKELFPPEKLAASPNEGTQVELEDNKLGGQNAQEENSTLSEGVSKERWTPKESQWT